MFESQADKRQREREIHRNKQSSLSISASAPETKKEIIDAERKCESKMKNVTKPIIPMTPSERKRVSRAKQSAETREKEYEKNRRRYFKNRADETQEDCGTSLQDNQEKNVPLKLKSHKRKEGLNCRKIKEIREPLMLS